MLKRYTHKFEFLSVGVLCSLSLIDLTIYLCDLPS